MDSATTSSSRRVDPPLRQLVHQQAILGFRKILQRMICTRDNEEAKAFVFIISLRIVHVKVVTFPAIDDKRLGPHMIDILITPPRAT